MDKVKIFPSTRSYLYALKCFLYEAIQNDWHEYNELKKEKAETIAIAKQRSAEYRNDNSDFPIADYSRPYWNKVAELGSKMDRVLNRKDSHAKSYQDLKQLLDTAEFELGQTQEGRQYKILVVDRTAYVEELLDLVKSNKELLEKYKRSF